MNSWLGVLFLLLLMLTLYFIIGSVIDKILKIKHIGFMHCVSGYLICNIMFALIALPMEINNQSLTNLTFAWLFIILIFIEVSLCFRIKRSNNIKNYIIQNRQISFNIWYAMIIAIILLQIFFHILNGAYGSILDNSTYNGIITTSLYTDTMLKYDPYTGLPYEYTYADYLAAYEIHSAVICKLSLMHPLIFINQVISVIEIFFYNIINLEIFKGLFKKNIKKMAVALGFLCLFNCCTILSYTPSGFLFFRTAESKSMLANFIIPLTFLGIYKIYKNSEKTGNFIFLFLVLFSGCTIGSSSIFIPPVMVICGLTPILITKKNILKNILTIFLIVSPNIGYAILYMLWK